MDTQTQIDRLIELAIIQRTELKQLVEQLPQLREHLNAEVERTFEEAEPQIRTELEEFVTRQAADKTATLGTALEAKIEELAKSLEESAQAKYSALVATRDQNATLLAQAEERIAAAAGELPAKVKDIVAAELARFPRAGEIDQLRKEFAEPRGLNPRGKWQAGESYNKLDLVTINGDSYTSNIDGNSTRPTRSSADWTLVAARGTGGGGGPTSLSELTTVPSNGDILIGSGTSWVTSNLTAGAGISITVGAGEITISATDGDITLDDGTAASPSLHFTNDADTGLYRPAANTLGISVSGTQVAYFDTDGLTIPNDGVAAGGSFHGANGNANNPTFSFQSDTDTGLYRHGTNELGFTVGGTEKAVLTSTTFTVTPNLVGSGSGTFGGNLTVSGGTLTSGGNSGATLALSGNGSSGFRVDMFSGASGSASNTTYYNTTAADAGNASYGRIGLLSNTSNRDMVIDTGSNGTGTAGNIAINPSGGILSTSGNLTVSGTGTSSVAGKLGVGSSSSSGVACAIVGAPATLTHTIGSTSLADIRSTSVAATNGGPSLTFSGYYQTSLNTSTFGAIKGILQGAGDGNSAAGGLTFLTASGAGALSEQMRLTYAGNLLLKSDGVDSGNGKLQLADHTGSYGGIGLGTDTSLYRAATGDIYFSNSSGYQVIRLQSAGTNQSSYIDLRPTGTGSGIIQVSGTTALTLDSSSQNATFAGRATVSSTTASTSTSTGALVVSGGVGVAGAIYGTTATFTSTAAPALTLTNATAGQNAQATVTNSQSGQYSILRMANSGGTAASYDIGVAGSAAGTNPGGLFIYDSISALQVLKFAPTTGDATFAGTIATQGGTASTPASASATGTAGTIKWDASYIYVCTAANTWKRAAIATW